MEVEQAAQLTERVFVVVDPEVAFRLPGLALRGNDVDCGGLSAAPVTARRLGRLESGEEAPLKRAVRLRERASTIDSQTCGPSTQLACAVTPSPIRCPAAGMQASPVWTAAVPSAASIDTCRWPASGSAATRPASACSGVLPARISSRPSAP